MVYWTLYSLFQDLWSFNHHHRVKEAVQKTFRDIQKVWFHPGLIIKENQTSEEVRPFSSFVFSEVWILGQEKDAAPTDQLSSSEICGLVSCEDLRNE